MQLDESPSVYVIRSICGLEHDLSKSISKNNTNLVLSYVEKTLHNPLVSLEIIFQF